MQFILQPGKRWAETTARAWLQGCGGGRIVSGVQDLEAGPVALYGVTPETIAMRATALWLGAEYYYIDNAYFSPGHGENLYMRVTRNAQQCDGRGNAGPERFARHDIEIEPWRKCGKHILVTCQSEWWYAQHGLCLSGWLDAALTELRDHTDRPIIVRKKPKSKYRIPPNLFHDREITIENRNGAIDADLEDAHALVTHASNTAVEAVLAGVPAFVLGQSAAKPMACSDLALIEAPRLPEGRAQWAWNLAANQWTLAEIRDGTCWRDMNGSSRRAAA